MRTGNNTRLRKDGRYEARYIKARDERGRIIYGYCYGHTLAEAVQKREACLPERPVQIHGLSLLILGKGSHGQEVLELAQQLRIFEKIDFLDDTAKPGSLGPCCNFEKYLKQYPVAIPAVGNTAVRKRWTQELTAAGFLIPTLIHPTAVVSQSAEIGSGTVICARATISSGAIIGQGSIISCGSTIDRNIKLPNWSYVECGRIVNKQTNVDELLNIL